MIPLPQLSNSAQCAETRTAFSLTAVGHRLYLFGGHTLTDGFTDDLWEAEVHFESAAAPAAEQPQSPPLTPTP